MTKTDTVMDLTTLINTMVDGYAAAGLAWKQAMAMGASPGNVIHLIKNQMSGVPMDMLNEVGFAVVGGDDGDVHYERPLVATIKRLLSEAPAPLPGQTPAMQCMVLMPGGQAFNGSLSETQEGGLRMLSPAGQPIRGGTVPMVEQFFDYNEVVAIAFQRDVRLESSSIITNS